MSPKQLRVGSLIPAFVAAGAFALAGCGGGDTTTGPGPGPDPDPDPDPDPVDPTYETIATYAGTGLNGRGADVTDPLSAEFSYPQDIAFAPTGQPYLVDWNNHRIRTIENGMMRTVVGISAIGDAAEGIADQVGVNHPTHVSFDSQGGIIMSAWHNSKIMRYDPVANTLTRICGNGNRTFSGDGGLAIDAELDLPICTAFAPDGSMYITDQASVRIRRIDPNGIITTVAGIGRPGGFSGDGGPADQAQISLPWGQSAPPVGRICCAGGMLYFADTMNSCIRQIDLSSGVITTVAGVGGQFGFAGDGGPATAALLAFPTDVDVDHNGNLYIADWLNGRIRRVDTAGVITTLVGNGEPPANAGQIPAEVRDGVAADAWLDRPFGIGFGTDRRLYIADTYNHRYRVVY
jgi:sugar lactone lactonase YvrE